MVAGSGLKRMLSVSFLSLVLLLVDPSEAGLSGGNAHDRMLAHAKRSKTIAPGTISTTQGCSRYYQVTTGQTCEDVISINAITPPEKFYQWNTGVNQWCSNLFAGDYYCVRIKHIASSSSSSSSKATSSSSTRHAHATSTSTKHQSSKKHTSSTRHSTKKQTTSTHHVHPTGFPGTPASGLASGSGSLVMSGSAVHSGSGSGIPSNSAVVSGSGAQHSSVGQSVFSAGSEAIHIVHESGTSGSESGSAGPRPTHTAHFHKGTVSWYKPSTNSTACGWINTATDLVVAVGPKLFNSQSAEGMPHNPMCGRRMKIKNGGKNVIVTVADQCLTCNSTHFDLSSAAFKHLASLRNENVAIRWEWLNADKTPYTVEPRPAY